METDCIFCKIINGEIPDYRVYEDNDFIATLDINPINLGHVLVIPKAHFANIFEAPEETITKIGSVIKKLAHAIKDGVKADGLNVVINNEKAAGQIIFHAHVHLIPRFEGDGFAHWHGKGDETKADFENTQEAIKKTLFKTIF
jgi:histidine triad (HIT) family protein